MDEQDDLDQQIEQDDEEVRYREETKIANILLYGTPSAKQEVIIKLIYIGHIKALNSVLDAMSDAEYNRVVPAA